LRAVYRKLHLWDREKLVFTPGSAPPPVLDTRVGRLAVVICYDLECKTFTYQRIDSDDGVRAIAPHVAEISRADLMPAHEATATKRLQRLQGR
jgi:predicted amidohydrolase